MTKQKILEKALLKANKNGWRPLSTIDWKNVKIEQWQGNGMIGVAVLYGDKDSAVHWMRELEGIIFNKDFAKAIWGEGGGGLAQGGTGELSWWAHLQNMVIADDPIKYLGENI